jgi:hypothetical protein
MIKRQFVELHIDAAAKREKGKKKVRKKKRR